MLEDATGVGEFLGEMRDRTFKPHDAFTVGEVFNEKEEEIPDFIGDNGYFSSMFDFAQTSFGKSEKGWYDCKQITPDDYKRCCFHSQKRVGDIGFLSNIIENHDEPRGVSYYIPEGDCCDTSKKMLAALYFMLKGLPFIYQGQEMGMANCPWNSAEEFNDISTLNQYNLVQQAGCTPEEAVQVVGEYSRDNARTPFPWDDGPNAGFTTGKPWLKVNPSYTTVNAAAERQDPHSVLAYYKKLVALRKDPATSGPLGYGTITPCLLEYDDVIAYVREEQGQKILVVNHFTSGDREVKLPYTVRKVLLTNYPDADIRDDVLNLKPYQSVVAEI